MRQSKFTRQCWKRPVTSWPNAPNFCMGPPEISIMDFSGPDISFWQQQMNRDLQLSGHFGLFSFWATTLNSGVSSTARCLSVHHLLKHKHFILSKSQMPRDYIGNIKKSQSFSPVTFILLLLFLFCISV